MRALYSLPTTASLALLLALAPPAARANPADLLPPSGPHGAIAVPFAPVVPGAAEAFAATYLRADGRRLGTLLAAIPGSDYNPEVAFVAFTGGTPGATRTVVLNEQPFTLVTVTRPDQPPAFAIAFAATQAGGQLLVDPTEGAVRFIACSDAALLDHLAAATPLAFAQDVPAVAAFSAAPNPFAAATTLRFTLTAPADVQVTVFDVLGRRAAVLDAGEQPAGSHALPFAGDKLAPGVYVVRLAAGASVVTRRVTRR